MRYLFNAWKEIAGELKEKPLFIFLDFDGTLAPIVKAPQEASISKKVKSILEDLAALPRLRVAIISGRKAADIKSRVGLRGIIYAGSHGLEIKGAGINFIAALKPGYKVIIRRIKKSIEKKLSLFPGALVEDKGLVLSLHLRMAKKDHVPGIKALFDRETSLYRAKNEIRVRPGKMVREVLPPIKWGKAEAALWLLDKTRRLAGKEGFFPVYAGDDVSDEEAFKVLRKKGLTIFVSYGKKSSGADFFLKNTREVMLFLKRLKKERRWRS